MIELRLFKLLKKLLFLQSLDDCSNNLAAFLSSLSLFYPVTKSTLKHAEFALLVSFLALDSMHEINYRGKEDRMESNTFLGNEFAEKITEFAAKEQEINRLNYQIHLKDGIQRQLKYKLQVAETQGNS